MTQEARRYNREELDVPRCAQGPRFSDAKRLYRITLSDGYTLLAVEKEAEGPKVWFESLFAQWDMKEELERCFGPLVWRDYLEDVVAHLYLWYKLGGFYGPQAGKKETLPAEGRKSRNGVLRGCWKDTDGVRRRLPSAPPLC